MNIFRAQATILVFVLTAALFAVLHPGEARAYFPTSNPWANALGHSACGGIDRNGNLQEPCNTVKIVNGKKQLGSGWSKATKIGPQTKQCPAGSFRDKKACWACPDGFHRNLKPVTSDRACQKRVSVHTRSATFLGSGKCPSGTFFDPRNGGECWHCPSGYKRTLAKVDKWNACGKVGKKAHTAYFKSRACPVEGSIRDPRHGGECWICPPDYSRTANPVTGARACKTVFDFIPAVDKGVFKCKAGEIKSPVDGGTCWTCPSGFKRAVFHGIKTTQACVKKDMKWVIPERTKFGIFDLGKGADDILAKLIADRTQIDALVKAMAAASGANEATALKTAWVQIDKAPWDSPVLYSLLEAAVIEAAHKPANQRTVSETNLLKHVDLLFQWDRQFIANQSQQAYKTYIAAEKKTYDKNMSHAGAAVVYSDNVYEPPNFPEALVSSMQLSSISVSAAGSVLTMMYSPGLRQLFFPYRTRAENVIGKKALEALGKRIAKRAIAEAADEAAKRAAVAAAKEAAKKGVQLAAEEVAQQSAKAAAQATAETALNVGSGVAGGASAGFFVVAALATCIELEVQKYQSIARAEGQIRQSFALANRPVDIGRLLQQKTGMDQFTFLWSDVLGAPPKPGANKMPSVPTKPSAYFEKRLAFYKSEKPSTATASTNINVQGAVSAKDMGDVTTSQQSAANSVTNVHQQAVTPSTSTSTTLNVKVEPISSTSVTVQNPATATQPAPSTSTPPTAPTAGKIVPFDIVASTGRCLQAISNTVRLMPCNGLEPTHWISQGGQLKPVKNMRQCMTSRPGTPYMSVCRKGYPAQQWTLTDAGAIQSGMHTCLEARGSAVTTAQYCQPTNKLQQWKAPLVK